MASLLPTSLRHDQKFLDIEETIKRVFEGADLSVLMMYILDNTPPDALYYLAQQFNVLGLRGYIHATTDEEKRNLIRTAIDIHRHAGTPYAIKRALANIGLDVNRIEEGIGNYYLYNGQYFYNGAISYGADGHWAYFRVYINAQPGLVISATQLQEAIDIINEFKNVRSHLYDITVTTNTITDYVEPTDNIDIGALVSFTDGSGALYNGQHFYNGSITYGEGLVDSMNHRILVPDTDAQAFLDATGITDFPQMQAIQYLVSELKAQSLWGKMQAIYPIIGGSEDKHKFNLKDPRDLDEAYRLTLTGGVNHSALGMQGNGINAHGDSHYVPRNNGIQNNAHISFYTPSTNTTNGAQIGALNNSTGGNILIFLRGNSTESYWANSNNVINRTLSPTPVNGFYVNTRLNNTAYKVFKNGALLVTDTAAVSTNTNPSKILLMAISSGISVANFSTQIISFASIGYGLTDAESVSLNSIISTYQFMLGR